MAKNHTEEYLENHDFWLILTRIKGLTSLLIPKTIKSIKKSRKSLVKQVFSL